MASFFQDTMTGLERLTVSESGYTNEGIMLVWLDHFIANTKQTPDSPWVILLLDGCLCHETNAFVVKAKAYKIWLVKYLSHQTHLLQPLDVGCFRLWKHNQQVCVMDAIRSYEPEYNLQSFLRDIPKIRVKTFTKRTIKHAFRDSGMWPMSFKAAQKKIKEYGTKSRKDTGLELLEYGQAYISEDESDENELELPVIPGQLSLPPPRKRPGTYEEVRSAWDEINDKLVANLSSPSRENFKFTRSINDEALMRASLDKVDIDSARNAQKKIHKRKLIQRVSLQKGGSLLASTGLEKAKAKEVEMREKALKLAQRKLKVEESLVKKELYALGVKDRREERERKKWVAEFLGTKREGTPEPVPPQKLLPIRDRENNLSKEEEEAIAIRLLPFKDAVAREQHEFDHAQGRDYTDFCPPGVHIDPAILTLEREFAINQNPLTRIRLDSSDDEDVLSSPLRQFSMGRNVGRVEEAESGGEDEGDGTRQVTPARSVASIDSVAGQDDFVRFH